MLKKEKRNAIFGLLFLLAAFCVVNECEREKRNERSERKTKKKKLWNEKFEENLKFVQICPQYLNDDAYQQQHIKYTDETENNQKQVHTI